MSLECQPASGPEHIASCPFSPLPLSVSLRPMSPKRQGPRDAPCLTSPGPWGSGKAHHCLPGRPHSSYRRDGLARLETLGRAFALPGGSHSSGLPSARGFVPAQKTFHCQLHGALSKLPSLPGVDPPFGSPEAPGLAFFSPGPGCLAERGRARV